MCITSRPGFDELTTLSGFVNRDMFIRFLGVGIGYKHSATVAEIKYDLVGAVFESSEACFEFEDMHEESRDDGKTDDPGKCTDEEPENVFQQYPVCLLHHTSYVRKPYGRFHVNHIS